MQCLDLAPPADQHGPGLSEESTIDPPGDPHRTARLRAGRCAGVAAQVASCVVTDYPRPPDDTLHLYKVLLCLSHCSIYSDRVAPPSIDGSGLDEIGLDR
jgi:hypothetical protein